MVGRTLGHYEILEKLGEGGMGAVYKARDQRLERLVALKVLPHDRMSSPEAKRRFTQEAKAASALNHPNIITVYDISSEDGVDFIAMEYVDGRTLESVLAEGSLPMVEVLKMAREVASALAAAHAAGILHRDLKPANIMVRTDGLIKILDFGLAKLTSAEPAGESDVTRTLEQTRAGTILGTIAYMSPEQAEGKKLDLRSDVFSFGAVLYEMATGRRAFQGSSQASLLASVLRDEPKPAVEVRGDLPAALAKVIQQCLSKDPASRPASMAEVKPMLEGMSTATAILPAAPALAPPAKERSRRERRNREDRPRTWKRAAWLWVPLAIASIFGFLADERHGTRVSNAPLAPLKAVAVTGDEGIEESPSFSPDGAQLVYDWDGPQEDNVDIYVKRLGPDPPRRLTTDPAADYGPRWSPDGRSIAFVRVRADHDEILLIPAEGGAERKLGEATRGAAGVTGMAWTPDSKYLIVSQRTNAHGVRSLFLWSVSSGDRVRLTDSPANGTGGDSGPSVSPNGKYVAFTRGLTNSQGELFLLRLTKDWKADGAPRKVSKDGDVSRGSAWTADSQEIVYEVRTAQSNGNLVRVRIQEDLPTESRRLEGVGERSSDPAISPKGDRLAYSQSSFDPNIWKLDLEDGKTLVRTIASTSRDYEPRLSPDGRTLVFTSDRSGQAQVWIANADGSRPVRLTHRDSFSAGARISPDGKQVAFLSLVDGQQDIFLVPTAGGAETRLTDNPAHDSAPAWSPDGKSIYFASNRSGDFQVWTMSSDGANPRQITRKGGYAALPSADGKYLYYTTRTNPPALWRVPLEGGEETQILPAIQSWGDFAVARKGIYFIPAERREIDFYDFATSKTSLVYAMKLRPDFGITLSPDGRFLFFTQVDRETSELMLVDHFQ